jgi:hypothetical protein
MRVWIAAAACGMVLIAGCSGGSSGSGSGGGGTTPSAPTANAGSAYSGVVGTAVSFSAAGSSDPQGQALTYAWNFGDGATGVGSSATHVYATVGTFTATVTVTDTSSLSAHATAGVAVGPGLAGAAITGTVYGGQLPLVGAHVYLFAANTTGYGGSGIAASANNASVSLLNAADTGASDAVGAYVVTNATGGYSLGAQYVCTAGQQVYVYALGGNAGNGANAAAGLMAALGNCPTGAVTAVVNPVTTVAAAYALAGFATDATHVGSSGTALAQVGIANAFVNAGNLASLATGAALATIPSNLSNATGTAPQSEINTLANVLASCTTTGNCTTLLATATADGTVAGAKATDTASAAINIAHFPAANVAGLYGLAGTAFSPGLTAVPSDLMVRLNYEHFLIDIPSGIAIDGGGNAWIVGSQLYGAAVTKISSAGAFLSGYSGYANNVVDAPNGIAIDPAGSVWVRGGSSIGIGQIAELSNAGTVAWQGTFPSRTVGVHALAIDGAGNVWIACDTGLEEISNSGAVIGGLNASYVDGMAIDGSSNVWFTNGGGVVKASETGSILGTYPPNFIDPETEMTIDGAGNAWVISTNFNGGGYANKYSSTGTLLSGASGYPVPDVGPSSGIATDGAGNAWISDEEQGNVVAELSSSGNLLTPATPRFSGGGVDGPGAIAVDGSGDVWVGDPAYSVTEIIGAAVPVVTPLSVGVKTNMLGTRP